MSKQSLNEQEFIDKAYSAIASGNGLEVSGLMNEDSTELTSKPAQSTSEGPEVTQVQEVVEKTEASSEAKVEGEQPAKEGSAASSEKKDTTKPEDNKEPYAWVENLPEELKETVKGQLGLLSSTNARLEQYYRSNEGRTSALQRKINDLQRELEARKTHTQTPSSPTGKASASSDLQLEDDETLAQLKEDDPALYRMLKQREEKTLNEAKKLVEQAKAEFTSTLEKQVAPLHRSREDAYIAAEQAKVLAVVTNAAEVAASKEWKIFEDTAPPGVKALINSDHAEDAILAFQVYAGWLESTGAVPAPKPAETQQVVHQKQVTDTSAADKIEAERQRKLKAGAVNSASTSSPQGEMDQDRLLEQYFQQISEKEGYTRKLKNK